jgi:hypothetical protein
LFTPATGLYADLERAQFDRKLDARQIEKQIVASESNVALWEKESKDPTMVVRDTIGQNVWTGQSDTSVVFPNEMFDEGAKYYGRTGYQTEISPKVDASAEIEIPTETSPSETVQRNFDALDRFEVQANTVTDAMLDAILDGNTDSATRTEMMIKRARDLASKSGITIDGNLDFNARGHVPTQIEGQMVDPSMLTKKELDSVVGALGVKERQSGLDASEQTLMDTYSSALQKKMSEEAAISASAAMETASVQQATPVGQHAIPAMREEGEGVGNVQPVHLRDIAESILRDKVGSEAGNGKLQSDELVGIEEVNNKQYEEMRQIREGIETMIDLLKPSASTVGSEQGPGSRTTAVRRNVTPTVYGQLRNGQPGSGANKAVQKPFR